MTEPIKTKSLHIGLWVIQSLLAAAFGTAGFMKITTPIDQLLQAGMSFVSTYGLGTVRFIGISELLGAIGLILPSALRIKPILTVFAALGIATVMVLATLYHLTNNEPFFVTIVLGLLALFVAWGRYKLVPIPAK
jgi:uncharacterized membrane protein YphA (DoxX/SURF4 family)